MTGFSVSICCGAHSIIGVKLSAKKEFKRPSLSRNGLETCEKASSLKSARHCKNELGAEW